MQDDLADADITAYVKNGVKSGLVSPKALAYYADLENQGGAGASKRIATTAGNDAGGVEKVTLDKIHAYALKDGVMGQYESRRGKVYEAVKASDLKEIKEETAQSTPTATQKGSNSVEKGASIHFIGGGVFVSSTAKSASKTIDKVSTCKVTAVNAKGSHPYHCISQDGKGVYGWVNAESIKELATAEDEQPKKVSCGDVLTFTGGTVYVSSTAEKASKTINETSTCKDTAVNEKGVHPYHCISQDGKGVYGWVDKENIK